MFQEQLITEDSKAQRVMAFIVGPEVDCTPLYGASGEHRSACTRQRVLFILILVLLVFILLALVVRHQPPHLGSEPLQLV